MDFDLTIRDDRNKVRQDLDRHCASGQETTERLYRLLTRFGQNMGEESEALNDRYFIETVRKLRELGGHRDLVP